jgi:hypothetical protein
MGVSPMSALVSTSCAAALGRFPLVSGTEVHRDRQQSKPFFSFSGLFAPVHAQDPQIRSAAHRVLAAALYSWNSTTISSSCYRKNRDPLHYSTKDDLPQNIS